MENIRGAQLRKFNLRKIILGVRMHFRHNIYNGRPIKSRMYISSGAIFNDLERPLIWFSRSRRSSTLNISGMAKDGHGRRIGNCTQAFKWYHFQ